MYEAGNRFKPELKALEPFEDIKVLRDCGFQHNISHREEEKKKWLKVKDITKKYIGEYVASKNITDPNKIIEFATKLSDKIILFFEEVQKRD